MIARSARGAARWMACAIALLAVASFALPSVAAHPFHVCVGQMQWNAESRLWEVSLRVHPQDLERAVSESRGKPTGVEDPDFSEHVLPFLSQQFAIVHAPKSMAIGDVIAALDRGDSLARSELRWVGMEQERGFMWMHVEMIPSDQQLSGNQDWLVHRIFLDTIDRQENSVRILNGAHRYSLQFRRGQEAQAMKPNTVASNAPSRTP